MKAGFERFIARCEGEVLAPFKAKPAFQPVSADDVTELLRRLEADILPNIIPDGSLLGRPATFSTILNAAAIYRIKLLLFRATASPTDAVYRDLQKLERLTAKAFEVSYVQREFKAWETASK